MLPLHYGPSCAAWALIAAEQGSASASPDRSTIVAHTGGAVNPLTGFILATGYAEHLETLDGPRASHGSLKKLAAALLKRMTFTRPNRGKRLKSTVAQLSVLARQRAFLVKLPLRLEELFSYEVHMTSSQIQHHSPHSKN